MSKFIFRPIIIEMGALKADEANRMQKQLEILVQQMSDKIEELENRIKELENAN